jgi:peptide/nickel transport system substrate-binding protein
MYVRMIVALIAVLALACGSSATSTPTGSTGSPTSVAGGGASTQPTAVPQGSNPPTEAMVYSGALKILVGDLGSERFDVAFSLGLAGDLNYGRLVHGFLISDTAEREMVPGIASDWGLSADGLTWTFTISEGIMWQDGTELIPEDVLWSFKHLFGPEAKEKIIAPTALRLSRQAAPDGIVLNGRDVSMTTTVPATEVASILSESGTGWYHVMPERGALHDNAAEIAYDKKPIGAGPMKLLSHTRASSMTFERFDDYYYQPDNGFPEDKRIPFSEVTLFLVPEESTRVSAIRAGDADIAPVSLQAKSQLESGGGRLIFGEEGSYVWVPFMGCWADPNFPCAKKEFRQALGYAINKELIRDNLYGGTEVFQVKGWAAVTPSTIGYSTDLDPFPFDPDKARQLLVEAGYPGGKGVGKVVMHTWESTSMPFQTEAAQLAAEFWRTELGLDVEIRVGNSSAIRAAWANGELNGQLIWRDNETRRDATSTMNSGYADPDAAIRRSDDPEFRAIAQAATQTVEDDARAVAMSQLYKLAKDEGYEIGIGYANIPWGVGSRIQSWQPYPLAPNVSGLHTVKLK